MVSKVKLSRSAEPNLFGKCTVPVKSHISEYTEEKVLVRMREDGFENIAMLIRRLLEIYGFGYAEVEIRTQELLSKLKGIVPEKDRE